MRRIIARLIRKLLMVAALAAVVVLSIGVVGAQGLPQDMMPLTDITVVGDVIQMDSSNLVTDGPNLDDGSLTDLLSQFEGVRFDGEQVVLQGADGQEFTFQADLADMADRLSMPTGNPVFDLSKYGVFGLWAGKILLFLKRLVR